MKGVPSGWSIQREKRRARHTRLAWVGLVVLATMLGGLLAGCLPLASNHNQVVFSDSQHWNARLSLAGDTLPADILRLQGRLSEKGISARAAPVPASLSPATLDLQLEGSGGVEQVRQLLYGGLDPGFQPLGVSTEISLTGWVQAGEQIDIQIASNPTTGYMWEGIPGNSDVLIPNATDATTQLSPWLGAAGQQHLSFRGLKDGQASLRLVYHRPWEPAEPQYSLSLQAPNLAMLEDLRDPRPVQTGAPLPVPVPAGNHEPLTSQASFDLPQAFDWRTTADATPVRDQGACGSCWAFATTGVLEANILIQGGQSVDLSEQYLLSCNSDGWTCNGGQIAHNYHLSTLPPSELAAGAVLEKSFPYKGTVTSCKGPYQHDYRIQSWSYIGALFTPDVTQIKQAILQHGPISSTVCVGPAFTRYQRGLFATDEKSACTYYVNHAIVLVGWDDSLGPNGAWILRNSWGSGWGENGYMYIDRTISNIGMFSTYVDYQMPASPEPPLKFFLPIVGR